MPVWVAAAVVVGVLFLPQRLYAAGESWLPVLWGLACLYLAGALLWRVVRRSLLNPSRPDLPPGCVERWDAEFLSFPRYIHRFDAELRPRIEAERLAQNPKVPVVTLTGRREIAAFVTSAAAQSDPTG